MKITAAKKRKPLKTAAELQTPFGNTLDDQIEEYELDELPKLEKEGAIKSSNGMSHSTAFSGKHNTDDEDELFLRLKDEGCALAEDGNMGGALLKFQEALKVTPTSHILHELIAQAYLSNEQYVYAQRYAMTATELCPTWSDGFLTLARTHREMGEIVACMENYQRACDLDSNNVDAKAEMEELRPILEQYEERKSELLLQVNSSSTAAEVEANTCIFHLASRVKVER